MRKKEASSYMYTNESGKTHFTHKLLHAYPGVCVYYIYIYRERERERDMGHSPENWTKEGATFPMK